MRFDTRQRRWRLVEHLEARRGGASAAELAAALGVSERTVYRDLKTLGEAGLPLVSERDGGSTSWRLEVPPASAPVPPSHLAAALAVVTAAAEVEPSLPYAGALADAAKRVRAAMPGVDLPVLAAALAATAEGDDDRGVRLATLVEALETGRVLRLNHLGLGRERPVALEVFAVGLRRHRHGLLLVVEDAVEADGGTRALRVDRIRDLTLGEARRPPPVEHDLEAGYRSALGVFAGGRPLELRLEVEAAAVEVLAARPFHPTQHVERRPDGSARVDLTVTDTPELRGFIRAFGPAMTVLAPEHLARDLAAEAETVHRTYARRLGPEGDGRRPGRGPGRRRATGRTGGRQHETKRRTGIGSEPDPDA